MPFQASGGLEVPKSFQVPKHRSMASTVTFENRRTGMRRAGTSATELSGLHSAGEGGGTEDGETEAIEVCEFPSLETTS